MEYRLKTMKSVGNKQCLTSQAEKKYTATISRFDVAMEIIINRLTQQTFSFSDKVKTKADESSSIIIDYKTGFYELKFQQL